MTDEELQFEQMHSAMLGKIINRQVRGRRFDNATLRKVDEVTYNYVAALSKRGINFPQLVAVVIPSKGWIALYRRDLDIGSVRTIARNLAVRFPDLHPQELAASLKGAWPDYAIEYRPPNRKIVGAVEGQFREIVN